MKAVFAAVYVVVAAATGTEVTPVEKVVQLLHGMMEKGKADKNAEVVQMSAYKQFCEDTASEKTKAIADAGERIDVLKADITKYIADVHKLTKEIAEHEEDISVWSGDVKAATSVRAIEKTDYDAMHKDYSESISALERAIAVLKKQAHNRPQATKGKDDLDFVQLSALKRLRLIPQEAKRTITAFLEEEPDTGLAVSAPEADGYNFQSQGVIDMLSKLLDKFVTERTVLEKEEMGSKQAFEMLMQDLTSQIQQATKDRDLQAEIKAKKLQAKADAEGDLTDTTTTRDADSKYLSDLVSTCEQKATDFVSRQELRNQELKAIETAIEIVAGGAVAGNADKHLPTLVQAAGSSLAQSKSSSQQSAAQDRAVVYLTRQSELLHSRVLSALATHAGSDPFMKVKKMIKDLVVRLMEEANEETEHKGWCDTELGTNEKTRIEKTEAVETLHAEIDQLEASLAKISEEIVELTKALAELDAAMAKATALRQEEKAKNEETIADSVAAQTAVAQALTVLREFYAKAGEATALLQDQPEAPEIFDKPYQGMQAENGGVVGMLEVIQSDFARLESETKSAEATAQKEYDTFMEDSKIDKAQKESDLEHNAAKKQDQSQALTTKRADLEGNQKELDSALAYYDKLKPTCVDAGVSFEERVARRKEEIESLQTALRILNGEDM